MAKTFKRKQLKLVFFVFVVILSTGFFLFKGTLPKIITADNFTNAYASLGNSRFSYVAGVASGSSGSSSVTIDSSGNPDNDIDHLFPKDSVCFAPVSLSGCTDDKDYTVATTGAADSQTFTVSTPLSTTLNADDLVVATQSGSLAITFTLATTVPDGGDLLITIPMANDENGQDGFPDYADTVANSGFDLGPNTAGVGVTSTDVSVGTTSSGTCVNGDWSAAVITRGSGSSDHTIRIDRSGSSCEANSTIVTVTIDSDPGIVNPAPTLSSHTQGAADEYTINVKTRDNTDATIDSSNVMLAPVEAVFVSATVSETLSFAVAGVAAAQSHCGNNTSITSTATSIPWSTLSSSTTFYYASQGLTLSTNANNGYNVYIEENDQMGKDGATCTGTAPSTGHFTFSGTTCIRDTVCGSTPCTEQNGYYWTDATNYPGFGYSLENGTGTDAAFVYNSTSEPCTTTAGAGTFCAKQIADIQGAETRYPVMTAGGPVDASNVYVCYKIDIPGTQPAGYYYNTIKYTAIPKF